MSSKISILTSVPMYRDKPSSIRPMDNSNSSNMERKESFMFSNRPSVLCGCSLAVVACVGLASAAPASTVTVYSESFGGSATTATLAGTAPTVDNGTSPTWSTQWDASATNQSWLANGTVTGSANSGGSGALEAASLNFTPVDGHIYTLSVVLTPTGYVENSTGNDGIVMAGFINGDGTGAPFFNTVGPGLEAYFSGSTTTPVYTAGGFFGPGFGNAWNVSPATLGGTLEVVLNTTNPTIWSANGYYNGTQYGGWVYNSGNGTTNPTGITQVAIGVNGMSASVTNFTLTDQAVPEPATLALVAVGGLGLLLLKRRKTV
ncbi:MAG: PEP-CTERM sorting domain-containing protein [Phycisphaerae bacterium]